MWGTQQPGKIPDVCQVSLDACNAQGTTTTAIDEARRKARTEDKNEARHVKRKAMTEERKPFKESGKEQGNEHDRKQNVYLSGIGTQQPGEVPDACQVSLHACNASWNNHDEARRKARTEGKNEARHVKREAMTEVRKPFKE